MEDSNKIAFSRVRFYIVTHTSKETLNIANHVHFNDHMRLNLQHSGYLFVCPTVSDMIVEYVIVYTEIYPSLCNCKSLRKMLTMKFMLHLIHLVVLFI